MFKTTVYYILFIVFLDLSSRYQGKQKNTSVYYRGKWTLLSFALNTKAQIQMSLISFSIFYTTTTIQIWITSYIFGPLKNLCALSLPRKFYYSLRGTSLQSIFNHSIPLCVHVFVGWLVVFVFLCERLLMYLYFLMRKPVSGHMCFLSFDFLNYTIKVMRVHLVVRVLDKELEKVFLIKNLIKCSTSVRYFYYVHLK